jgi:predicted nucleic acid-binding protein
MTRDIIVADASCLIVLQNIGELSLLQKLFDEITITEEVRNEFGLPLPEWIKIPTVANSGEKHLLSVLLDKGEASSIALALEITDSILIIDEKKGRRIARELGLITIGTLGVILKAKEKGLIESTTGLIKQLESTGFYLSQSLKEKLLENE